jgi:hypothetical protein
MALIAVIFLSFFGGDLRIGRIAMVSQTIGASTPTVVFGSASDRLMRFETFFSFHRTWRLVAATVSGRAHWAIPAAY